MSMPDATATAALGGAVVRPAFLCWLDIIGDPVRATTWPVSLVMSGTGDPDLDGYTFSAVDPTMVDVSPVKYQEGGAESVSTSLSGLLLPDTDLLNIIGDESKWRGREARLWAGIYNEAYAQQGSFWNYYTGRMVSATMRGSAQAGVIEIAIETYLAVLTPASNRNYLDQSHFDPDDRSAEATLAVINGIGSTNNTGLVGLPSGGSAGADFAGTGNNYNVRKV